MLGYILLYYLEKKIDGLIVACTRPVIQLYPLSHIGILCPFEPAFLFAQIKELHSLRAVPDSYFLWSLGLHAG
jgi:hypothetical protein